MAKMAMAGASEPPSEGERLERARRRRKWWILGALFLAGFGTGFAIGFTEADDLFDMQDRWPPALAIGASAVYLAAVVVGAVLLSRQVDEVERMAKYKAIAAAGTAYVLVYPVWFLWWKGGLVPEPMHIALYVGFMVVFGMASLFYRFR